MSVNSGNRGNTRFAVNQVSTGGDNYNTSVTILSRIGKRSGSVTTNRLDDQSLREAVALSERLAKLSPESVAASQLAGEAITARLTRAPGNGAPIGGLKVTAASGWFAARPSGTENIYKVYAESFRDPAHLEVIVREAQAIVGAALKRG